MKSLIPWLGPIMLLLLAIHVLRQDGSHWGWGRLGMPAALLDESDQAYRDGTSVDAITLAIATSGYEQEAWLAVVTATLALLMWGVMVIIEREERIRADVMRREFRFRYGLPQEDTT